MKADAIKLDGGKAGSVDLNDAIFGLEPRKDILHRVVRWQRNKGAPVAHVTGLAGRQSSAVVGRTKGRHHGPTHTTCPRSSASWVSSTRCLQRLRRVSLLLWKTST